MEIWVYNGTDAVVANTVIAANHVIGEYVKLLVVLLPILWGFKLLNRS